MCVKVLTYVCIIMVLDGGIHLTKSNQQLELWSRVSVLDEQNGYIEDKVYIFFSWGGTTQKGTTDIN